MSADRYGVVGHPVSHSWSPFIHAMFARRTGQALSYRLYDFRPDEFAARVAEFFTLGGKGLNITLPHKLAAVALASTLTTRATHAGAVNTLAVQKDGSLLGDNTDGAGLVRDLCDNLGLTVTRRRLLIIGAGGATRGVLAPLLALEPAQLVLANRTSARAHALAESFAPLGAVSGTGFDELAGPPFDLVINATSASLSGEMPAVPAHVVGPDSICYDMAYSKTQTAFTQWANQQGCAQAHQGWGMLVEQAAESFRVWRGIRPETAAVLAALKARALSAS
ncbi:MAG: shikimate dehydrogenase [Sinobacteraceae bacterium]|nr:shikimate dehydrogenase [Nevskiaceae bacterium]MBV8854165.1 shikimate dehydrogenase [Nevskiaceae bacterium]MBV9914523.1 shikimate dehydrogenase [Nevskiaceae bacterium]